MTLARSKKAGEDLKAIEESMRRMKEKEKGKAKAIDKVKRERDCMCVLLGFVAQILILILYIRPGLRFASYP